MRYASEHKRKTRERILQVAARAIRLHGVGRVSLNDIMSGAKLTNGGFYGYFKSKDDLIAEAIKHTFDERHGGFLRRVGTSNPRQALAAFIDHYLSIAHCAAPEFGCPIPVLAADVPHMTRSAKARFSAGMSQLLDGLATLLEDTGVVDAQDQARSILSELVGALALARTCSEPVCARRALLASRRALKQRYGLPQNGIARRPFGHFVDPYSPRGTGRP